MCVLQTEEPFPHAQHTDSPERCSHHTTLHLAALPCTPCPALPCTFFNSQTCKLVY